jgi:hypothetical protein
MEISQIGVMGHFSKLSGWWAVSSSSALRSCFFSLASTNTEQCVVSSRCWLAGKEFLVKSSKAFRSFSNDDKPKWGARLTICPVFVHASRNAAHRRFVVPT